MKHLEIEMKTLLNKDEYQRLQDHFSGVTPITQKNYYLDTPDSTKSWKYGVQSRFKPRGSKLLSQRM